MNDKEIYIYDSHNNLIARHNIDRYPPEVEDGILYVLVKGTKRYVYKDWGRYTEHNVDK